MSSFLGSGNNSVFFAAAILVIAFVVWTQNLVDNSVLVLLAALALLAIAVMGRVHEGDSDFESPGSHGEIEGLHEHPEAHEEEAHGYPAGH